MKNFESPPGYQSPDVGLVRRITVSYIVVDLGLPEVAYTFSKRLSPVTMLYKELSCDTIINNVFIIRKLNNLKANYTRNKLYSDEYC